MLAKPDWKDDISNFLSVDRFVVANRINKYRIIASTYGINPAESVRVLSSALLGVI